MADYADTHERAGLRTDFLLLPSLRGRLASRSTTSADAVETVVPPAVGSMFIDPHAHMISRTTDDHEAMARAGVVAVIQPLARALHDLMALHTGIQFGSIVRGQHLQPGGRATPYSEGDQRVTAHASNASLSLSIGTPASVFALVLRMQSRARSPSRS